MFNSSVWSLTVIQFATTVIGLLGLTFYHVTSIDILEMFIGYFLLSCVGVTVFYHRYLSHHSFKTNKAFEIIGIILGILAGRGSPIGWVSVHRQHHKYADVENDPHPPGWRIFFPYLMYFKPTPYAIRDLIFNKYHMFIDKYYNLILLAFVIILGIIDFRTLMFLWIIPAALTAWALNMFVYLTHSHGYRNFDSNDFSTNNWFISLILWGEGWHNNHHMNTKKWKLHVKWWEIDPASWVIRMIKSWNIS